MNLTKQIKERMIRSIMGDIKEEDIGKIARDEVLTAAIEVLPPAVRKIWDDPKLRSFVNQAQYHTNCGKIQGHIPCNVSSGWLSVRELTEHIGEDKVEILKQRCGQLREQQDRRRDTVMMLEANFGTVRTAKAFRERFPDLAKYLPPEPGGTANLPATNDLVDRLKAAGLNLDEGAES